mmetsp:Transcript_16966/g.20391  ORF Transcript_16966/g.20391 Transcript_16966/m.20391 type:complete len:291 (-) Transcript_16966:52-924(-)
MIYLLITISLVVMITASDTQPRKVLISGAGGQTGQSLFRKILALPDEFEPLGLVRTEESKSNLVASGIPESKVAVVDVTDTAAVQSVATGCSTFFICTSAKPKPTGDANPETGRPIFGFPDGSPEEVDWHGQKIQIDACGPDTHVVLCSTMGGTDSNHMLNRIGQTTNEDGSTSGGNIVKWKRKAEVYLIDSGKPYTIVHPGGLKNEPGGERELVLGVDDGMEGTESRTVPREDVAELMLQAAKNQDVYMYRSFDLRAKEKDDGTTTTDFRALVETLGGRNCDYSLGEIM